MSYRVQCVFVMASDDIFANLDWNPQYLCVIFDEDFYDMAYLWNSPDSVSDNELLESVNSDSYKPIIEDISLDDDVLVDAVDKIESE